jgi:hypothetical protein
MVYEAVEAQLHILNIGTRWMWESGSIVTASEAGASGEESFCPC